ncbi:hypothetical protein PVK06_042951 [Gossypium arboreum]|uniref:Uncharacterized protein n=1 Tax=Gossypium arboreum TaxID=29729 RepID=A0ABR0MPP8_GOSAR|nr:hypothetical protein PVK06_042951 [Gossypium arboreum]
MRKTNVEIVNVVINSEEEANNGSLESCHKRRADHVGPFVMMVTTLTSLSMSSKSVAYESSSIVAHGSSPSPAPLCISPPPLPLIEDDGQLLPSRRCLSTREL